MDALDSTEPGSHAPRPGEKRSRSSAGGAAGARSAPSNKRRAQNAASMRKCRRKEKDAKAQLGMTIEVLGNSVDSLEERLGGFEALVWSNPSVMDSLPLPAAPSGLECRTWFRNSAAFWTESRRACERFLRGWLSEPGDTHIEGEQDSLRFVRNHVAPQDSSIWALLDRISAHFHQTTPALLLAFVRCSRWSSFRSTKQASR
jgi:hypothetical protein